MIEICWNCRGLGNPQTVLSICELNKSHKPDFFVQIETHAQASRVQQLKQKMGYEGAFCVESVGRAEGMAIFWSKARSMSLLGFSDNHIDMEVLGDEEKRRRLTGFYGHPERHKRHLAWDLLRSLRDMSTLPGCYMGDFNGILCPGEKKGGAPQPTYLLNGFNEAVSDARLQDIPLHGYLFTWGRAAGTNHRIEERLDRAMTSEDWCDLFPNACLYNLGHSSLP